MLIKNKLSGLLFGGSPIIAHDVFALDDYFDLQSSVESFMIVDAVQTFI